MRAAAPCCRLPALSHSPWRTVGKGGVVGARRSPPPAICKKVTCGRCVGIDLGTSNSAVACIEGSRAVVIPSADGIATTPSVVAFSEGGGVVVGAAARRALAADPCNTFASVKRLMGRALVDVADPTAYPFALAAVGEGGAAAVSCPVSLSRDLAPEEVSAEVIRHLLDLARAHTGDEVDQAVVTVPADFSPAQRVATERAAALAGLGRVQVLQEPVAAAMAYGLGREDDEETGVSPPGNLSKNETQENRVLSNERGTCSIAHFDSGPPTFDNGNTEFFINLQHNAHLDTVYGGYCVFAEVDGEASFAVVDKIKDLVKSQGSVGISRVTAS